MILKMGHLAHFANMRATSIKISISWMIDSAIMVALITLWASIDDMNTRFAACEGRQGETFEVTTSKVRY